ncbi:hypothetical protein CEXT_345171, partial [Caerostris extrusa]
MCGPPWKPTRKNGGKKKKKPSSFEPLVSGGNSSLLPLNRCLTFDNHGCQERPKVGLDTNFSDLFSKHDFSFHSETFLPITNQYPRELSKPSTVASSTQRKGLTSLSVKRLAGILASFAPTDPL